MRTGKKEKFRKKERKRELKQESEGKKDRQRREKYIVRKKMGRRKT
jgi:hypothetical protein